LDLVEEVGKTKPRTVSELMEVANRFADGEDAYNNKRGRSPEVDRASRQRRRYRNGDNRARRNQIAAGYERRDEEGYESREFQARGNRGVEKPKYSGPSAEDMLHGPCRIHYAYLDGKRVSNHQMKDCRTFLRLQSAMELNQGARQGGKSMSQGYQVQRPVEHLESKVYISAMIQPVPKSKKKRKSVSRQVNLAISSPPATTEYLRWSDQPVRFSRIDHPRKVPRPGDVASPMHDSAYYAIPSYVVADILKIKFLFLFLPHKENVRDAIGVEFRVKNRQEKGPMSGDTNIVGFAC
jgi:hypothetical protein